MARLRDEGIPYTVVGGLSLFETAEIRDVEQSLRAIADPHQDVAQRWFDELRDGIAWRSGRRLMYEREVDAQRQRDHFKVDDPALPPALAEAATVVREAIPAQLERSG